MKSSERRALILQLLDENVIETQESLLSLLKAKGVETTQATVSRDIKKLNLIKSIDSQGKHRYLSASGTRLHDKDSSSWLRSDIKSVDYSLNNVVIHCGAGMAQAVGAGLDQMELDQVLGCIAGDDTVLVVTRSSAESEQLLKYLNHNIGR